jgi:hypothetical protein
MIAAAFERAWTDLVGSGLSDLGRTGMRKPIRGCALEAALAVVGKWKPIWSIRQDS